MLKEFFNLIAFFSLSHAFNTVPHRILSVKVVMQADHGLMKTLAKVAVASSMFLGLPIPSQAADKEVPVYFGVGCFWHVQHEFVTAEKKLLGRGDADITAITGYAGGNKKAFLGAKEKIALIAIGKKREISI